MRLRTKFLALLVPVGAASALLILVLIRKSVHGAIVGDLGRSATVLAQAAAQDAEPGFRSRSEALLLPVLQSVQKNQGALYAAALDPRGLVLAHTSITEKGKIEDGAAAAGPSVRVVSFRGEPALEAVVPVWSSAPAPAASGDSFLLSGELPAPTRERAGTLKVGLPLEPALRTEERIQRGVVLIVGAIGGAALLLVLVLVRGILEPVNALMEGIARIHRGQYDVPVPLLSKDELGDLARSFNGMSGELVRTTVSKEYVEGILENMLDPLVVTDPEGRIETVNPAAMETLRFTAPELAGRPLSSLFPEPPEALRSESLAALSATGGVRDLEATLRTKDGRDIPALVSASALTDRNGRVRGYVGVAKDMTERKRIENALLVAKTAAETANKELEAFSYSVAHDLRAPLRSINGFSQALLENYSDKLDEEGRDFLGRVRAGSARMALLIDDLLRLAQVSRSAVRAADFDISALARDVAAGLKSADPERAVRFVIADGLKAHGDPALVRAALENLIGNSWKYTKRRPSATIEFGETVRDGRRAYFVRDDGAGFDMAFAKKLFSPFSRLHTAAEFEGTGIGLATVQRIISRHGGSIWGESAVDKGAVFYFTLPENRS